MPHTTNAYTSIACTNLGEHSIALQRVRNSVVQVSIHPDCKPQGDVERQKPPHLVDRLVSADPAPWPALAVTIGSQGHQRQEASAAPHYRVGDRRARRALLKHHHEVQGPGNVHGPAHRRDVKEIHEQTWV